MSNMPSGDQPPVGISNGCAEFFHPKSSQMIIASCRQAGNPLLSNLRNVSYELANIIPDYLVGKWDAVLFISIKYHRLHPLYIKNRVSTLEKNYRLRVLLCYVDVPDCESPLLDMIRTAFCSDLTLVLCWTLEEAGRLIETFKAYENKPPDAIRGKLDNDARGRAIEVLTTVSPLNKTDAATLLDRYGTIKDIFTAKKDDLQQCPGIGTKKINNLLLAFNEPFFPEGRNHADGN